MSKRIFRSILIVATSVLLLSFVFLFNVLYRSFVGEQKQQCKDELAIAAHGMEASGLDWLKSLDTIGYRLTLVSSNGTVLYDSEVDAGSMENHLTREEIAEALQYGSGESERTSTTLTESTLYQALRLTDGNVLRISITRSSILSLLLSMIAPGLIVLVIAIILAALLAKRITKRTMAPLNNLDLEHPLENDAYDELSPLLVRIAHQKQQIDDQISELNKKQDEFFLITSNMNEGLVLLNEKGIVVSVNPAAQHLFQTDNTCIGQDFLIVERGTEIRHVLQAATKTGHGQTEWQHDGRQYEIDANRIDFEERTVGTAILLFDVTEKAMAEQQRREFTANVSHELKTPLQSIMGSAELIENGLVKQEDLPHFAGRIRTESARLVSLIDDIIRLSQLDEGTQLPKEKVDLYQVASETLETLDNAAAQRQVRMSLSGHSVTVNGVRGLLKEIIYNLCDNAIKYNVEGGTVQLSVIDDHDVAIIQVKDTGIGIPLEHQNRVFERFYRVDKSHSKQTGGTGLGLSIVKHAVAIHNGKIELDSHVGQGTTITVKLPK